MSLTVTATTEVKLKPVLKAKLLTELQIYARLYTQLKGIEAEMEQRKATIARYREEAGVESLQLEGFSVTRVSGNTRSVLNLLKLVAMGVTTEMLAECTDLVPTKPFEKITCPRKSDHA